MTQTFDTLFMTVAPGIVALNIICEGLVDGCIDNDEKVAASARKYTQFKTRVLKPYPVDDGQNRFLTKWLKNYAFWGRTYLHIAHIRDYPRFVLCVKVKHTAI